MRIFDDPKHPHYGPVRRQWVLFKGLGLLDDGASIDTAYYAEWGMSWDIHLSHHLVDGWDEAKALRRITYHALDVAPLRYLSEPT